MSLGWEIQASPGPACETLGDGRWQPLVRVRMFDEGQPHAFCDLLPDQARELAHSLLACAQRADYREALFQGCEQEHRQA